jgi:hypothetical protein
MKLIAVLLTALLLSSGCATAFYVGHGQEQSFKSLAECQLAHPEDPQFCVDRAQYTQASQNTIMIVLQAIGTAALAALSIFVMTK